MKTEMESLVFGAVIELIASCKKEYNEAKILTISRINKHKDA